MKNWWLFPWVASWPLTFWVHIVVLTVLHLLVLKSDSIAAVERAFSLNMSCDVLQTAFISYDYLTAFKGVEYGTEDYVALRSKVDIVSSSHRPLTFTIHGTLAGSCLDKAVRSEGFS